MTIFNYPIFYNLLKNMQKDKIFEYYYIYHNINLLKITEYNRDIRKKSHNLPSELV